MNTPWKLEQPEKWPFDLSVVDATGTEVLSERRYAHSTDDKSVADVIECIHFKKGRYEASAANKAQIAKLEGVVRAVNVYPLIVAAIAAHDMALANREHGGLAAHNCVDAIRAALEAAK